MLKIAYVSDSHLKSANPASRTDQFETTVLRKFIELGEVARAENVNIIVHGGDLFDIPKVSERLTGLIAEIIKQYPVPMLVVPGNHDLYGYTVDSIYNTTLGVLAKAGVISLLTRQNPHSLVDKDAGFRVSIQGQEYHAELDRRDPNLDYHIETKYLADYYILAVHGMLIPTQGHPDMPWTDPKTIPAGTNVVMAGHWHPGFDPMINKNGTLIINYGSMGRDKATNDAKIRMPGTVILDIDNNGISHRFIPFNCALPGDQILNFNTNHQKYLKKNYLANYKQSLQKTANFKGLDVMQLLVAKAQAVGMLKPAMKGVKEAEQNIDTIREKLDGYIDKGYSQYISEVEVENFQSHKLTKVNFDNATNAITGPSNNGKTALLRAIRWCLFNDPQGADFIRTGAKKARVKVTFSDGTWIERERTPSNSGKYTVFNNQEVKEFKGFSRHMPPEIANIHQMPDIHLSNDVKTNLNIAEQLSAPFLLSESSATRAVILGNLTGVHVIDAAIKETGRKIKSINIDAKSKERQAKEEQDKLANFADLPQLETKIAQVEVGITLLEQTQKEINEINQFIDSRNILVKNLKGTLEELQRLKQIDLNEAERTLDVIVQLTQQTKELQALAFEHTSLAKQKIIVEKELSQLPDTTLVPGLLQEIELLQNEVNELSTLLSSYSSLTWQGVVTEKELQSLPDTSQVPDLLQQLEPLQNEVNELIMLINEGTKIYNILGQAEGILLQTDQEVSLAERAYRNALKKTGTCPVCLSDLSSQKINVILESA